jgi:hypothetical protein
MCLAGFLKPGVALLSGKQDGRREREELLLNTVRHCCGGEVVKETRLTLRKDEDKDKVYGHASEVRGGLFKLIDDCNNLNGGSAGFCVIVCEVNEVRNDTCLSVRVCVCCGCVRVYDRVPV